MWKLYVGLKSFYQRSTFKNIMRRTKYNPKLYQQIIYLLKKLNIIIKTSELLVRLKKKQQHFEGSISQRRVMIDHGFKVLNEFEVIKLNKIGSTKEGAFAF